MEEPGLWFLFTLEAGRADDEGLLEGVGGPGGAELGGPRLQGHAPLGHGGHGGGGGLVDCGLVVQQGDVGVGEGKGGIGGGGGGQAGGLGLTEERRAGEGRSIRPRTRKQNKL